MSSDLIDVADAAYPFDYSRLPSSVRVVLGYVGESGCTPHVWSTQDVAGVRQAGLAWGPIVVPPQRALVAGDGIRAAQAMAHALPQYSYPRGGPVFIDIEHSSYVASPSGAADAVAAWRKGMAAAGYPLAVAYWPQASDYTWLPRWGGGRPSKLPAGCVGWQYQGGTDGDRYDLSVFAPSIFTALLTDGDSAAMALDSSDQQFIVAQLGKVQQNLADMINALHVGVGGNHTWAANMTAVLRAVTDDAAHEGTGGMTDTQVTALGATLAAELAKSLPSGLVKALAAALAS